MKKKGTLVIRNKVLLQMGLLSLCVMGMGLFVYMVCTSEYFAALLNNMTGFDLSQFQSGFRSFLHTGSVGTMLFIFVLAVILVFLIYWVVSKRQIRYLNEIDAGLDVLLNGDRSDGETLHFGLSREMFSFEEKLRILEQGFIKREQAAQRAESRKNRLVISLAQEIKTPLVVLLGYMSRLNNEPYMTVERRAETIGLALEKTQEMHELLNDFFEITHYSLENAKLSHQILDLNQMFAQIIDLVRPLLINQDKEIVLNAEEGGVIFADSQKIAKAFYSIIKKAVTLSETSVTYIEALCKGNQTIVSITSYGKTIRKETLESLLENFYYEQEEIPPADKTGLGLSVAHEIVLLHNGHFTAQSEGGKTVFTVILPLPYGAAAGQQQETGNVLGRVHLPSMALEVPAGHMTDIDHTDPQELEYSIQEHGQAGVNASDFLPSDVALQTMHWQDKGVSLDHESNLFNRMQTDRGRDSAHEEPRYQQTQMFDPAPIQKYPSKENQELLYSEPESSLTEYFQTKFPQGEPMETEPPQVKKPILEKSKYPQRNKSGSMIDRPEYLPSESLDFTYFEPDGPPIDYLQMEPQAEPQIEPQIEPRIEPRIEPQAEFQTEPQIECQTEPLQTEILGPVYEGQKYPQRDKLGIISDRQENLSSENQNFTYFVPDMQAEYLQLEYPQAPQTEHLEEENLVEKNPEEGPGYGHGARSDIVSDRVLATENLDFTYFEPENSQEDDQQTEIPDLVSEEYRYSQEEESADLPAVSDHAENDIPNVVSLAVELSRGHISDMAHEAVVSQTDNISMRSSETEFYQADGVGTEEHAPEKTEGDFVSEQGDPLDTPVTQADRPNRDYHIQAYHHKHNTANNGIHDDFTIQRGHGVMHKSHIDNSQDEVREK